MCDNKPSCFNKVDFSTKLSTKNTKISNIQTNIDKFYDNRKVLFDICGNIINKDKYLFIDILSTYLVDIVNSIDIEINKSTRNSMINWREKKNPKLLSKFINSDDNINIINRSMNKITSSNYMTIVDEISDALTQDNFRKIPEYCKYLFDTILKKCLNDELFIKDYLQFLVSFKSVIKTNINDHINNFITEISSLLYKNNSLASNTYLSFVKDVSNYYNIGIIFANLYIIKSESNLFFDNVKLFNFTESFVYEKFMACLNIINNFLDWLPSDMTDLNGRIYLIFGIIEVISNKLFELMNESDRNMFNDILTLIYNVNNIPNKIKFKVLDIQDIIKTFEKTKKTEQTILKQKLPVNVLDNLLNDIPEDEIDIKYDLPVQTAPVIEKKIYKPINYSSLKLVQMQKAAPESDPVLDVIPNTEKIILETIKQDVVNQDVVKSDSTNIDIITQKSNTSENNNQDSLFYKAKKNYKNKYKDQNSNICDTDKSDNSLQNKKYYKNNKNYNSNTNINTNTNSNMPIANKYTNTNNLQRKQNDNICNKSFNDDEDDGFIKVERKGKITNNNNSNNSNNTNNSNNSNNSNNTNNSNYDNKKNLKKY